jgi:hypothetical protein
VRWPADRPGTVQVLAADQPDSMAHAIGDDGTVYGTISDGGAPVAWPTGGAMRRLPVPAGDQRGKVFAVAGDWAFGWAGTVASTTPTPTPLTGPAEKMKKKMGDAQPNWVRWHLSTGRVETLGGFDPSGINRAGTLAGQSPDGGPALWRDGTVQLLPRQASRVRPGSALAISDDGSTIVGSLDEQPAILWRC